MSKLNSRIAKFSGAATAMTAGLSGGGLDTINIRNSVFTLMGADGTNIEIEERYLDVILIIGNPYVSKQWFGTAFDPTVRKAPDCYSHNGVGPSSGCASPQSKTCAKCPHDQWGTGRKADGSPSEGKACGDRKLVAALPINHPEKPYQLNIPPTSLKNFYAYIREVTKTVHQSGRGMEPFDVFTRITFDRTKPGQVLMFSNVGDTDEDQVEWILDLLEGGQCDTLIASGDTLMDEKLMLTKMGVRAAATLDAPVEPVSRRLEAPKAPQAPQRAAPSMKASGAPVSAKDRIAAARAAAQSGAGAAPGKAKAGKPRQAEQTPPDVEFADPEGVSDDLDGALDAAGFSMDLPR